MNLMKQIFSFFLLFCVSAETAFTQEHNFLQNIYQYIEDPRTFAINQEEGHVPQVPFSSVDKALSFNFNQSPNYLLLNGEWKFRWFETPEQVPKDFFASPYNDAAWNKITVPGNWEMQGYGDPVFRNISQPFRAKPPQVPHDYNPTGAYRRTFVLPADWKSKPVFLRVEAATSASFIWVNGKEVGFNEGANEPAEYNITPYLKEGENTLAICVTKYSAGTYLEDQDMWRLAGIFRDVWLYTVPDVHLRDYYVRTDFDPVYKDAELNITAQVRNFSGNSNGYTVRATLLDVDKKTIVKVLNSERISIAANVTVPVQLNATITNPKKWTSETPNLYYLTLELLDANGKVMEALADRIGFKKVEVKHQALLVNGVPVKLNGVNSHMQHPDLGHTMDTATIRKDMTLMKQFNINLVRTSHYPPTIDYLRMADEMGIYVVDETGDESHATEYVSTLPEWTAAYVDRVRGMVLRDRNHPSIIFWSAGNESGFGNNICEVIKEGKRLDPTRIFMYGGNTDDVAWRNEVPCEDIIGPRYPTPYELKARIAEVPESQDPRPSFMDEYVAATGNGAGGLDEYWELIYHYPRLSGGAIWDYVSPGIREKIQLLKDDSKNNINVAIKGRGQLVDGKFGKGISLNGHDQWIDVYRDPALDITGKALTLSAWVYPRQWNGDNPLVTKGMFQYGLNQFSKDSIEFYLTNWRRESLRAALPSHWEGTWHHVAGVYDGNNMSLYVDGKLLGQMPFNGTITNKPYPVCIGHFSDTEGQEFPGNCSNAIFDRVAIFNKVIPIEQLFNSTASKDDAVLWLELDDVQQKGDFFSMGIGGRTYGLIWPDRTPQPEMYQVKKSAQPVKATLLNAEDGTIEIWNRQQFTDLNELKGRWQLQADDKIVQQGELNLLLAPLQKKVIKLPFNKPALQSGVEYRLLLSFGLKENKRWAPAGFEVAWDQLELPWKTVTPAKKQQVSSPVSMKENNEGLTISGKTFEYNFDKKTGRLSSAKYGGKSLINDGPKLNVWRAPVANDQDQWTYWQSGLSQQQLGLTPTPVNGWYVYGINDLTFKLDSFFTETKANKIIVHVIDHAEGTDYHTAFDNHYTYTITGDGELTIDHTVTPQGAMPLWLPKVGLQWSMNKAFNKLTWYGRGPFETYPDRKTGAKIGVYNNTVEGFAEKYLIPQDYGSRTDNRWIKLEDNDGVGVQISGSDLFNFSAQQYSTENMTRARYNYQLQPLLNSYTLNVDYATSGVGCTAISVLDKYRVYPNVYHFTTTLKPYKK
jgi:beta-galactosidase